MPENSYPRTRSIAAPLRGQELGGSHFQRLSAVQLFQPRQKNRPPWRRRRLNGQQTRDDTLAFGNFALRLRPTGLPPRKTGSAGHAPLLFSCDAFPHHSRIDATSPSRRIALPFHPAWGITIVIGTSEKPCKLQIPGDPPRTVMEMAKPYNY